MADRRAALVAGVVLAVSLLGPFSAGAQDAVTVYTGPFSGSHWEDFLLDPGSTDYEDAGLVAVAPSWRVIRLWPGLSLEVEGQVVRHFGDQRHWELNGLMAARYRFTGESKPLRSSAAFGLGPSWASERPPLERRVSENGATTRWLVYWYLEAAVGHRDWGPWSVILRLHHRSGAFGWVAAEGGSNVPALGVRRRF